ncbi:MAG: class I SAM-dependent methyltransferase [Pseudomonadota bacterium]
MPSLIRQTPHRDTEALYAAMAGTWHSTVQRLGYGAAYRQFFAACGPASHSVIADLGTGSGAFVEAYLDTCADGPARCTLVDTSPAMLEVAVRTVGRHGVATDSVCAGVGGEVLPPNTCDAVLAAHVIEHLPDPVAALEWCRSRLVVGGALYLAISRPHWCTALLRWKWGHRAYRPADVVDLLAQAGFSDIRHIPFRHGPPSRTSAAYLATAR